MERYLVIPSRRRKPSTSQKRGFMPGPQLKDVLISCFPVYDRLCQLLPLLSVIALSMTCRDLHDALTRRWDINTRLAVFVDSPLQLRSLLARHAALVSGSFVIQFFLREYWPESDLDIFVEADRLRDFHIYLLNERYQVASVNERNKYSMDGLLQTHTYLRGDRKIQIVTTSTLPILAILTGFYMTAVVNVISWNKAYSLFAWDTFVDRKSYMLKPNQSDVCFYAPVCKYTHRGWSIDETTHAEDYSSNTSIRDFRRLGDGHTWMMSLGTQGVDPSPVPDYVLESSVFLVCPQPDFAPSGHFVEAKVFQHICLSHRFVIPETNHGWEKFLRGRLHSRVRIGIMAMKREDRAPWTSSLIRHPLFDRSRDYFDQLQGDDIVEEFRVREGWKRFDEEVPRWYDQWYTIEGSRAGDCASESDVDHDHC